MSGQKEIEATNKADKILRRNCSGWRGENRRFMKRGGNTRLGIFGIMRFLWGFKSARYRRPYFWKKYLNFTVIGPVVSENNNNN